MHPTANNTTTHSPHHRAAASTATSGGVQPDFGVTNSPRRARSYATRQRNQNEMINVNLHRPSAPLFQGLNEDLGPSRQEDKTKSSKMKQKSFWGFICSGSTSTHHWQHSPANMEGVCSQPLWLSIFMWVLKFQKPKPTACPCEQMHHGMFKETYSKPRRPVAFSKSFATTKPAWPSPVSVWSSLWKTQFFCTVKGGDILEGTTTRDLHSVLCW